MKGEVWAQKYKMPSLVHLSLVPNHVCLLERNSLVSEIKFLWLAHFCNSKTVNPL